MPTKNIAFFVALGRMLNRKFNRTLTFPIIVALTGAVGAFAVATNTSLDSIESYFNVDRDATFNDVIERLNDPRYFTVDALPVLG